MLYLVNIQKSGSTIEADYYPEDSCICGHVVVDLSTEELLSYTLVDGYGMSYPGHAMWKLSEIALNDRFPEKICVAWY